MMKVAWTACFAVLSGPCLGAVFDFTPLPVATGTFRATGLNDTGLFVGEYNDGTPDTTSGEPEVTASIYRDGVATPILVPRSDFNTALFGLNDAGLLVGQTGRRVVVSFAYQDGQRVETGVPGAPGAVANDVNNLGQIAGSSPSEFNRGVFVSGGVATVFLVPGSTSTTATGLNDAAQIVGTYRIPGPPGLNGFLLDGGVFTEITVPGGTDTRPAAINNAGTIVGTYQGVTGRLGFIQRGGMYSDITDANGAAFLPVGLNNAGQIVGAFEGGTPSFVGTPRAEAQLVPEPSSLALAAASLALLSVSGRRRRSRV